MKSVIVILSLGLMACAQSVDYAKIEPVRKPVPMPTATPTPKPTDCFEDDDNKGYCVDHNDHDRMKQVY